MAGECGYARVSGEQSGTEALCQRDIGRVVSRQIATQTPYVRQKNRLRIAVDAEIEQIIDGLLGAMR